LTFRPRRGHNQPPFAEEKSERVRLATLEKSILGDIAAASDEAALETVRVAALGKKGSISALLATLGKMSRTTANARRAINLAKDKVIQALTARRDVLKSAALDAGSRPRPSTSRCRSGRRPRKRAAFIPSAGAGRTDRDLRRHGFFGLPKALTLRPTITTSRS